MAYYFKAQYPKGVAYSPNWYGTYDVAPKAEIILYDDNNGFCIGSVESSEDAAILSSYSSVVFYANESAAMSDFFAKQTNSENVYWGDKLLHRWDVIDDG